MTRYSSTMREILSTIREGKSVKENPEDMQPASPDEGGMAKDQLEFMKYAADEIMQHIENGGEFPEWMQNKLSGTFEKMKSLHANIDHSNVENVKEEFDLDEMKMDDPKLVKAFDKLKRGDTIKLKTSSTISKGTDFVDYVVKAKNVVNKGKVEKVTLVTKGNEKAVKKFLYKRDGKVTFAIGDMGASIDDIKEETLRELEEGKSSTGYELYHKDFSSAMAHAYDFAKKKFGIEVDPKEIDDKVASGPRKPSKGNTNSYRLKGKDGKKAIQVQVYGMDNGKYELNMYKEETMKEAALSIAEKLKVSDGLGAWITDFQKSDAPQFDGKSDEDKKKMAIAAFVDAGGKLDESSDFKPHMMYDPKTGKEYKAEKPEDHERMAKMGYTHEKPDVKEMREPYAVVDTADGNKVVGTASDERGAKSIITSAELPPMKIKDKKTLKIVKVKKKQMIGYPIKEEEELDEVMATWKVTVVKPVNKLKKGDSVSVKANNIPQALKKSAKAFGDSNLVAVPSTHFDVQKEETLVKKEVEVKESTNPYVDAAAKHISTMWKEAAKVKKEEDEPKKKEDSKTTMTGKPMSGVQVNPLGKE